MTFGEFKPFLEDITVGDRKIPNDTTLVIFLSQSMKRLAVDTKPLTLLSNDISEEVLFITEDGYFIRVPNIVKDDSDVLDMDDDLILALAYLVASHFGHSDNYLKYMNLYYGQTNNYNWGRYETSRNLCFENEEE
jgi:hypothetical protein